MIEISLGIIAYNEEQNIGKLIDNITKQKTDKIRIKEILIFSDGSTDKTNEIIKKLTYKQKNIKLFINRTRKGKYKRINDFFSAAESKILVLMSADILLAEDTIERLCLPFENNEVSLTTAKPIITNNKKNLFDKIVHLNWELHHKLSEISPKGVELMAFRKPDFLLNRTTTDEEFILAKLKQQGKVMYEKRAFFYKKAPTKLFEFISQIRRNYAGHLFLKKSLKHKSITLDCWLALPYLMNFFKNSPLVLTFFAITQAYGRLLGYMDFVFGKKDIIWNVATSTKNLEVN